MDVLHNIFWVYHKHNRYPLGQYETSSPNKEIHSQIHRALDENNIFERGKDQLRFVSSYLGQFYCSAAY